MIIDFKSVSKKFHQGTQVIDVLDHIDLQVQEGETVAILGESGSGKSTLLSLISGLEQASEGQVLIMNKDFSKMNEEEITLFRGQSMGIVFQTYYLVPYLTALENVLLPLDIIGKPPSDEVGKELLKKVKLDHRENHFFHQLSGGEAQRVALARAIIHNPQLILADEPSGNLDEETGQQVMNLLFELVEKSHSTLVLVTHNRELANRCHRVLNLKQGKLREL